MTATPAPGSIRRDFLRAGSLAILGPGLARAAGAPPRAPETSCIFLFLVGGPSQLDTWDMKPDAPAEIRGPFRPISTSVPGISVSEIFPRLSRLMDRVALIRTLHHGAIPVHDTGHQLLQTGRLFSDGVEHPHIGSALAAMRGSRGETPAHALLPSPIGPTGGNLPHGQSAGYLGSAFDPAPLDPDSPRSGLARPIREALDLRSEPASIRDDYGPTRFGRSCLAARRLVERGTRFVTVNMYETVFDRVSWDAHGSAPFPGLDVYKSEVGPAFDAAYSGLIEDLSRRGMLDSTMVVAVGEFGRTPRINASGGRDHHTGCWSALLAGGPIRGGSVVGRSDGTGHAPADRPVSPAEFAATIYEGLGLSLDAELPGPSGPIRLVDEGAEPIRELF